MTFQASIIFDEELTPKQGLKIPFGIHAACEVVSLEKGDDFVDINFRDSENKTHNKRLWSPKGNYPKDGETTAQALEREAKRSLSHIVKLMSIFLTENDIKAMPALDYDPFIDKAISMLSNKLSTKKVNLKLIYDSDGVYSTFGNFPDYIEEYVEGQEPTLQYSKWELENRCTPGGPKPATSPLDEL
ncbi:hypothetical protein [Mesotoga prima]|uniref:hypothetical protein n=1 Tax=Mesotoga prima TaxID=1184387 RepID=UPI002FDB8938